MKVRRVQGAKDDEKVSPDISDIFFIFIYLVIERFDCWQS